MFSGEVHPGNESMDMMRVRVSVFFMIAWSLPKVLTTLSICSLELGDQVTSGSVNCSSVLEIVLALLLRLSQIDLD